jgi:hypothetical protein
MHSLQHPRPTRSLSFSSVQRFWKRNAGSIRLTGCLTGRLPAGFPSQQIQDYLSHAKDATGRRFFDWAILTNGTEWRLYCEQSAVGAYFSFHLVRDGQVCPIEDFRLFFTLFRACAFERTPEEACFLDQVREQSLRVQADLESNLRKRIFGVLEDLGSAFMDYEKNGLREADFPLVYDKSLIRCFLRVITTDPRLLTS